VIDCILHFKKTTKKKSQKRIKSQIFFFKTSYFERKNWFPVIGFTPWSTGQKQVAIELENEGKSDEDKKFENILDQNHTHFIMYDPTPHFKKDIKLFSEKMFRSRFETRMFRKGKPVINFLVSGDIDDVGYIVRGLR